MRLFNIDYKDLGIDDLEEIGDKFEGDENKLIEVLKKGGWSIYNKFPKSKTGTIQLDIEKNNKSIVILFFEGFGRFASRFSVYL